MSVWSRFLHWATRKAYYREYGEWPEQTDLMGPQTREDIAVIRAMPSPRNPDFDLAKVIDDVHKRDRHAS